MNPIEKKVLEAIDFNGLRNFIGELVSIPSYNGKETEIQRLMIKKLSEIGFRVEKWDLDFKKLRKHPDFSMSIPREEGLGVVGVFEGSGEGNTLLLCGHVDTVAPGDEKNWNYPALKASTVGGKIFGRGVCDMKTGIACAYYAVKAIQDAGIKLKGNIIFSTVIGEEDGGPGALDLSLREYSADAGIIMEPSENKIAPKVAGAVSFKINIKGKAVHACVKHEGISAIDKFIYLANGLKELEKERNSSINDTLYKRYKVPFAISIGVVNGGEWPGSVPENLTFEGRIGVIVDEPISETKKSLENKIIELSNNDPWLKKHPPNIEWKGYEFASSSIPIEHPIIKSLKEAYTKITGYPPILEGMTYASDARHLMNIAKIPTTIFGPGDIRTAHGPDEYVLIKEVETYVKILTLAIMQFVEYNK